MSVADLDNKLKVWVDRRPLPEASDARVRRAWILADGPKPLPEAQLTAEYLAVGGKGHYGLLTLSSRPGGEAGLLCVEVVRAHFDERGERGQVRAGIDDQYTECLFDVAVDVCANAASIPPGVLRFGGGAWDPVMSDCATFMGLSGFLTASLLARTTEEPSDPDGAREHFGRYGPTRTKHPPKEVRCEPELPSGTTVSWESEPGDTVRFHVYQRQPGRVVLIGVAPPDTRSFTAPVPFDPSRPFGVASYNDSRESTIIWALPA